MQPPDTMTRGSCGFRHVGGKNLLKLVLAPDCRTAGPLGAPVQNGVAYASVRWTSFSNRAAD